MNTTREMKWIRENEINAIYQCRNCEEFYQVPRGCDIPYCSDCDDKGGKEK